MDASTDNWIGAIIDRYDVWASAPCRVDMGGTLDIATFYYPLQKASPCTFNAALNLRTSVMLSPYRPGYVKISSQGFESAVFPLEAAPFTHALGLMFAVAVHFNAGGLHIQIESASPPRSALGGSSVAAVALVAALARCRALAGGDDLQRDQVVRRAQLIEETVAGVPCGIQDQLAAAYGGANTWYWDVDADGLAVRRESLDAVAVPETFRSHVVVAYGGLPHESRDVNTAWVRQFLAGEQRSAWRRVVACVRQFSEAIATGNWAVAAEAMNAETAIRREMTPEVLDDLGTALVQAAATKDCGGRFTGAGGGGCLWAVGEAGPIRELRSVWGELLAERKEARLLDVDLDREGLTVTVEPRRKRGD
jgi:D-glycero-alpha-D-manno-heptose-7-phosphate kinase